MILGPYNLDIISSGVVDALAGVARSSLERTAIVLVAAALLLIIGASRVHLGVHDLTDVVAGLSFGTAWALRVLVLSTTLLPRVLGRHPGERRCSGNPPAPS